MKRKLLALLVTTMFLSSVPVYAEVPKVIYRRVYRLGGSTAYVDGSKTPDHSYLTFDINLLMKYIKDEKNSNTVNSYLEKPEVSQNYKDYSTYKLSLSDYASSSLKTSYNLDEHSTYQFIFLENTSDSTVLISDSNEVSAHGSSMYVPPKSTYVFVGYDSVPSLHNITISTTDGSPLEGYIYIASSTHEGLPFRNELIDALYTSEITPEATQNTSVSINPITFSLENNPLPTIDTQAEPTEDLPHEKIIEENDFHPNNGNSNSYFELTQPYENMSIYVNNTCDYDITVTIAGPNSFSYETIVPPHSDKLIIQNEALNGYYSINALSEEGTDISGNLTVTAADSPFKTN